MARTAIHDEGEIEAAKRLAGDAKSLMQLRQSQAILIPALTGASLETTAEIVGLSRDRVCVLRRQFRASDGQGLDAQEKRGGRRRELMSAEEEVSFLAPWSKKAEGGGVLVVPPIHAALEQAVGHKVPKSTVYRMLARHGWRKLAPDTHHPKVDVEAQGLFKKTLHSQLPKR
jgi:transposase